MSKDVAIFQGRDGSIEIAIDPGRQTLFATQKQMAVLFGVSVKTINDHIESVYGSRELSRNLTIRKIRIVQTEGQRSVSREVLHYSLDMIISVGYRVNSVQATKFRQWATKVLKKYSLEGFAINSKMVKRNLDQFLDAISKIKSLSSDNKVIQQGETLDLVAAFAHTWLSLDAYDKSDLPEKGATRSSLKLSAEELSKAIDGLKIDLINRHQATELFARPRGIEGLESILGNIYQTYSEKDVYDSVEEKAAHLLYFLVKNHIFIDGNKRSGAFAFVWYLERSGILDPQRITPEALTTLTLLIAESKPASKDQMIGLILLLIK